jgi:hypothetical protein
MNYGNYCSPYNLNRQSIDTVSGVPIIVEDFVIPVFKGSTLSTDFRFPFELENSDIISIANATPEVLENVSIVEVDKNTRTLTWNASDIEELEVGNTGTFRVKVERSDGSVKTYNEITIRVF